MTQSDVKLTEDFHGDIFPERKDSISWFHGEVESRMEDSRVSNFNSHILSPSL